MNSLKKIMPERGEEFSMAVETVRARHDAGIKILVGSDSNNTNALCHIKHGDSLHRVFKLLGDAGKRADIVLVEGDSTKDISVCRNIRRVWVKGIEADLTK